jgi:hypothetical protein
VPPPAPPIQPAPPGGARKEARQRQAAAQKSGSDSGEEGVDPEDSQSRVNLGNDPSQAATRHSPRNEPLAFTATSSHAQASAWARNLQWGGSLTLMALVLALGWMTVRPTPRRRQPELPAPAHARATFRARRR